MYPLKSTQIFSRCLPDFFLIYKYDTQPFSGCLPEKNLGRFYRVPFKSLLRMQIKRASICIIALGGGLKCQCKINFNTVSVLFLPKSGMAPTPPRSQRPLTFVHSIAALSALGCQEKLRRLENH